jgi:hypothetical protein
VVLVVISQIKINVTNAYSGSLAWTSAWTRTTKRYPGRIIFVIVNLAIALALMEGDMFSALSWILAFTQLRHRLGRGGGDRHHRQQRLAQAGPAQPEYRRGMIYNVNPVGVVSLVWRRAVDLRLLRPAGAGAVLAADCAGRRLCHDPADGARGRYYIKQVDDGIAEPRYDAAGTPPPPCINALAVRKSTSADVMHSHKHQGASRCVKVWSSQEGRPT